MSDPASDVPRSENVKHLEMIQAVVTRLANNSFLIKGWTLTVAAAAYGFAVNRIDWKLAVAGTIVVLGFWFLDTYYLRQERLFRHLYNRVRKNITTSADDRFAMTTDAGEEKPVKVFFSITLMIFYPVLIVAGVAIALIAGPSSTASVTPSPSPSATR